MSRTPLLLLVVVLASPTVDAGFFTPTRTTPRPATPSATPPPTAVPTVPSKKKPSAARVMNKAVLPALSYASLGAVGAGAVALIKPALAWQGVLLLGGCVATPMVMLGGQLLVLGGAGIAKAMGGRPADARLTAMAQEAAEAVGVPPPANVYIIDRREPNAFAAGLSTKDATVAVTRGLDDLLSEIEMKAVLAHEMGHVAHRDMSRNMHIALATAGLGGLYEAGRLLLRSDTAGGRTKRERRGKKDDSGDSRGLGLALMAVGAGSQGLAHLMRLGASRSSELDADRAAAAAFGAEPMISALTKINEAAHASRTPDDLRSTPFGRAMAFSMISDGPTATTARARPAKSAGWLGRLAGMLRTHPPVDERVSALEGLAATGEVPWRPSSASWLALPRF